MNRRNFLKLPLAASALALLARGAETKTANPERALSNLDIFGFELSEAEMTAISALARPDGRVIDPGFAPDWDRD